MAAVLKQELITVACHEETSATDLIGRHIIKGSETVWLDGPMTTAVKTGAILYLDEIVEARPDVLVAIHSVTDHRRELFVDRLNLKIKAHPQFLLVASFNPHYQKGWKELKPSLRQRFVGLSFTYPDNTLEAQIICKESALELGLCKTLVQLAHKIRLSDELGLVEKPSTRLLVDAALLVASGLSPRIASEVAIVEALTDDPQVTQALKDLVALYF